MTLVMNKNNSFSVVIPARNEEFYIEKCLKSLVEQDYTGEYEIIVVDNGSTDRTRSIAENFKVKFLRENKKGISNALIKGCNEASGEILVFTDADTIVPKNWLSTFDKIFTSDAAIVAAGGLYEFYDTRFLAQVIFNKILKPLSTLVFKYFIFPNFNSLPCANLAVKKSIYKKVGGFNSQIRWGQEIDLVRRLSSEGKICFDNKLQVRTSFRRYDKLKKNGLVATVYAICELYIQIYRALTMLIWGRRFTAQNEIRNSRDLQ